MRLHEVVIEVALSSVWLIMRSFVALQQIDLGLNLDNLLHAGYRFRKKEYKTASWS